MADVLKSAAVASEWWGKKICDTANIRNFFDVGCRSNKDPWIILMGTLNATMHTPTPETAKAFTTRLQEIITGELENNPENHQVLLQCVETPSELLRKAAIDTGIDLSVFPLYRTMMVNRNTVLVSDGRRMPYKNLIEK